MLYYLLFWTLLGFIIHFYIIFGANLLTGGLAQNCCLLPILGFRRKEYQTESKRNETFSNVIFSTNVIQETWSDHQETREEGTRQGGRAYPPGCALLPMYFFLLYISIYPANIEENHENLIPPPQPSVPKRSHLGAFSGAPPEGALITEGLYINKMGSHGYRRLRRWN